MEILLLALIAALGIHALISHITIDSLIDRIETLESEMQEAKQTILAWIEEQNRDEYAARALSQRRP
jgi:hypothetical protein